MVINEEQKNAFTQSVMGDTEGGGGGSGSIFVANDVNGVLDKTAGELLEAYENGSQLFIRPDLGEGVTGYVNQAVITILSYSYEDTDTTIEVYGFAIYSTEAHGLLVYGASSLNEYPMS